MSVTKKARRSDSLYFDNSRMPRRTLCDMVAQLEEDKSELRAENAKLRELAKEACELARVFCDCGGTFNDLDNLICGASELGVEVS